MRKPINLPSDRDHFIRLTKLHNAIEDIFPIESVRVKDWEDKSTWHIDFREGTPPEIISSIEAFISSYNPYTPTIEEIKAEAERRILELFPEWKQRNMIARGVELVRIGESNWNEQEQLEAANLQAAWDWIKAVRETSNELEVTLPIDYTDDKWWPSFPA